jgi:hypothetical protein
MDTQLLFNTLQAAVSQDASIRVPAYEMLQSLKQREGYALSLLQVALTSGVEPSMRRRVQERGRSALERRQAAHRSTERRRADGDRSRSDSADVRGVDRWLR